jgi:glucan 1,3-beta-glucosidase
VKGCTGRITQRFPALWEGMLGALLILGSLMLYLTNEQQVTEINIFSTVMLVQSLPFLAAVAVTLFERSSLNDFATWRKVAALAAYRPRLPRGRQPSAGPPASGDIGILP